MPRCAQRSIVAPSKRRIDNLTKGCKRCAVASVEGKVGLCVADLVTEQFVRPTNVASDRPGIRIEQDFVRVEAMPLLGLVRAVDSIAVELPRNDVGQVDV